MPNFRDRDNNVYEFPDKDSFTVGRSPVCDVSLPGINKDKVASHRREEYRRVSRVHIEVVKGPDGEYILQDRGSSLGTYISGKRINGSQICRLIDGQQIWLGELPLWFHKEDAE